MENYKTENIRFNNFIRFIFLLESFYLAFILSSSKEVLLSVDNDKNSIIEFGTYFSHSINLSIYFEIIVILITSCFAN